MNMGHIWNGVGVFVTSIDGNSGWSEIQSQSIMVKIKHRSGLVDGVPVFLGFDDRAYQSSSR
jgi:hypothetical protein